MFEGVYDSKSHVHAGDNLVPGLQSCLWDWSTFHARGAKTYGTVHFAEEGLRAQQEAGVGLANIYKYLTGVNEEVGPSSFSVVPTDSTKDKS